MAATKTSSCPPGLVAHSYEREFALDESQQHVWDWLNDPETFIRGQPWPYFVEFVGGGFEPGVQNTHTGPFLHCCGEIGEVREPEYRDLRYHYGAFVLRMRWIRPTRLQFWIAPREGDEQELGCTVRVRLDSHCRSWLLGPWNFGHRCFWKFFGWSMRRGLRRAARQRQERALGQAQT
ncbi:MAG: hypothetical protein AB8H80_13800 [Planctomycetota bacterium]